MGRKTEQTHEDGVGWQEAVAGTDHDCEGSMSWTPLYKSPVEGSISVTDVADHFPDRESLKL